METIYKYNLNISSLKEILSDLFYNILIDNIIILSIILYKKFDIQKFKKLVGKEDAQIFLKTHINSLYFGHVTAHVEFPDELKFTGPTEEESWINYKNIYNYPKNFLYTTVYLNKPW